MGANLARQAFLNLPGDSISARGVDAAAAHQDEDEATMTPAM